MGLRKNWKITVTPEIGRYIQESTDSVAELANELGLSIATVRKWRSRAGKVQTRDCTAHSSVLFTLEQELLIVEIRRILLLSLDDLLTVVRTFLMPSCSRSSLDRLLRRHGVCRVGELVPDIEEHKAVVRKHQRYLPGHMRLYERSLPRMQDETFRKHLFLSVDRATSWIFMETRPDGSPDSAAGFLRNLSQAAPFCIWRVLTADRPAFTSEGSDHDHFFAAACRELSIEQHVYPDPAPGESQLLSGLSELAYSPFASSEELEKKLLSYCYVYNTHIPLRSLGRLTPVEKLNRFHASNPELFKVHPAELAAYPDQEQFLFYQTKKRQPTIAKSKGIYMWDTVGKRYLDGSSGAVVNNIGHGDKRVIAAMEQQAQRTFFAYRTQFENEPSKRLAKKLVQHTSPHLNKVFYVSGGSEAVESAMKVCRQYFFNLGEGSRYKFISRVPSYHGATLGALALTSYAPLEVAFKPLVRDYPKIPAPYCYRCVYHQTYPDCGLECAWALERVILEQGPDNVAAFVTEPVGGASTGALVPPKEYFAVIQHICRKYGVLLILDEVMTGFGRTGRLFAYEHWGVEADIIALSKGIASGYYPLGAVLTSQEIVNAVVSRGGFAHGHTYAGNPMACTVGLEVLNIILEEQLPENAAAMGKVLLHGLEQLQDRYSIIGNVRGLGLLTAIELVRDTATRDPFPPEWNAAMVLTDNAFEEGLIIYPRRSINGLFGDHVLVAPPLIINEKQIGELLDKLERALKRTSRYLADAGVEALDPAFPTPGLRTPGTMKRHG